ncbi:MAG: hypothetical protein JO054_17775 [Actinobacteria bacterium]|nr:hypothetical protein [Actinomycetota bacterium]MBV9256088.1 hypothetical protein [Actinomycetota bacterium]
MLGAIRTITLNPTPQAAHSTISISSWLVGSVVPMWIMARATIASFRVAWRLGKRRRVAAHGDVALASA